MKSSTQASWFCDTQHDSVNTLGRQTICLVYPSGEVIVAQVEKNLSELLKPAEMLSESLE